MHNTEYRPIYIYAVMWEYPSHTPVIVTGRNGRDEDGTHG